MSETKRVPREPTQEMIDAAITTDWLELGGEWRAMYDAAPDVPSEADTLLRELVRCDNLFSQILKDDDDDAAVRAELAAWAAARAYFARKL